MEVLDDGGKAAGVIVVGVRERYDIELADGTAPQIGRHDVLPNVDTSGVVASEREQSAAVDEHQFGIGETDQQAIALSDVDGCEFEIARLDRGRERMPEDQCEEHKYRRQC